MKCPYCFTVMKDGLCLNYGCEHTALTKRFATPHANHVLLAIPHKAVQGLRVGDLATALLHTVKLVWIDRFSPFVPGSGREKDANAILKELEERETKAKACRQFNPLRSELKGESLRCRECGLTEEEHP